METIVLRIGGMACGGCSSTVRKVLLAVEGVSEAEVSHVDAQARIQYDPARVTPEQLAQAVSSAGYQVT